MRKDRFTARITAEVPSFLKRQGRLSNRLRSPQTVFHRQQHNPTEYFDLSSTEIDLIAQQGVSHPVTDKDTHRYIARKLNEELRLHNQYWSSADSSDDNARNNIDGKRVASILPTTQTVEPGLGEAIERKKKKNLFKSSSSTALTFVPPNSSVRSQSISLSASIKQNQVRKLPLSPVPEGCQKIRRTNTERELPQYLQHYTRSTTSSDLKR